MAVIIATLRPKLGAQGQAADRPPVWGMRFHLVTLQTKMQSLT